MTIIQRVFKPIEDLFLWASGADREALDQVPFEKSKFYGIGGTIVFTALMATFSGGYAFSIAFKDKPLLAMLFGLFWGALIFNLDRFIVTSFGVGDGKRTISRQELIEAAPRLLLAIALGIVISTPLELKIFEREIKFEVETIKKEQAKRHDQTYTNYVDARDTARRDLHRIEARMDTLNRNRSDLINDGALYVEELINTLEQSRDAEAAKVNAAEQRLRPRRNAYYQALNDSITEPELGALKQSYLAVYNEKNKYLIDLRAAEDTLATARREKISVQRNESARINSHLGQLDDQKTDLANTITRLDSTISQEQAKSLALAQGYDGLSAELQALDRITEERPIVFFAKWMITLLFIFIEIAPVLFKMMTERGAYDDILDQKKYEVLVNQQLKRSRLNEGVNTILRSNRQNQDEFLKAEIEKNRLLLQQMVEAQNEIATEAIKAWKEEQLAKVKENVSKYFKTGNTGPGSVGSDSA